MIPNSPTSTSATSSQVNIFDAQGVLKIHQVFNNTTTANMNVSNLLSGIYIVQIVNGSYIEKQNLQINR